MNKELQETYKNLSQVQQANLKHKFKDSPLMLRLMQFLSQSTEADFKTSKAVEYIYGNGGENTGEAYNVLENRYFKLRKKLYDELAPKKNDDGDNDLPGEEALLNRCKHMIAMGNKKEAYKLLAGLEKDCWDRNIFELLPSVLDNMIFCNQGFNEVNKNKALYQNLEKAIELQYDLNRAIMYIRQVYEAFFTKGHSANKALLATLKELGDKHKEYPRFIMFYHYVSVSYKLSSMHYVNNMQVISRHLSRFKTLYMQNPKVPLVIYKAGHEKLFHFQYNQITTFYYTNKAEYEEAYYAIKEMWNIANSGSPLFRSYKTDSLYFNTFTMQCVTGRYKDALDTCNKFAVFVKENKQTEKLTFINMMKGVLYVNAYPQTFRLDADYLLEQTEEYIKARKREGDNIQLPFVQAMLFKAEMYLLRRNYKSARRLINDDNVKEYLHSINANDLFAELLMIITGEKSEGFKVLEKKITQRQHHSLKIDEYLTFNWLSKFAERYEAEG